MTPAERPEPEPPENEDDESKEPEEDGDDGLAFPAPFAPDSDDDSPLGDTDQHSDA